MLVSFERPLMWVPWTRLYRPCFIKCIALFSTKCFILSTVFLILGLEYGGFAVEGTFYHVDLKGFPSEGYYATVNIGTPPQKLTLLVDTGSSNLAVACSSKSGASKYFDPTRSKTLTREKSKPKFSVFYTKGEWSGSIVSDLVSFSSQPNLTVRTDVSCIESSKQLFTNESRWEGIIGLAFQQISKPDGSVKPYLDNLLSSNRGDLGLNLSSTFSLLLCRSSFNSSINHQPGDEQWFNLNPSTPDNKVGRLNNFGSLILGSSVSGANSSSVASFDLGGRGGSGGGGKRYYVNMTRQRFYEVLITDISVENVSIGLDCKEYNYDKTIVDSGTTNIRLPPRVYNITINLIQNYYRAKVKSTAMGKVPRQLSSKFWSGDDMLCMNRRVLPYTWFPVLYINLAINQTHSLKLAITPMQYLREVPRKSIALSNVNIGAHNNQTKGTNNTSSTLPLSSTTTYTTSRPPLVIDSTRCYKLSISIGTAGSVIGAVALESAFYTTFDRAAHRIGFSSSPCLYRKLEEATQLQMLSVLPNGLSAKGINDVYSHCSFHHIKAEEKGLLTAVYVIIAVCVVFACPVIILSIYIEYKRRFDSTDDQYELMGT